MPVPGDAPVPVDRLRPGNPAVLPMTGTWRFKLEHGTSPAVKGELPADAARARLRRPRCLRRRLEEHPRPRQLGNRRLLHPHLPGTPRQLSDDIGLYRRWVDVPASFAGQRVLWHFDGVYDGAEVFVNGQRCGYHESGFTAFDIDVTKALKPGQRNLMAVRVYKKTSSANLEKGDFWCLGGIYRETYLVALPPLHVEDVTVVTDLDAQYKDATLKSTVRVAGPAGAHFVLTGELYSLDGAKVAFPAMSQAGEIGADGSATVVLSAPVTAPKLWSAEKPNLYYVFYRLSDGNQTVERVQDRIGFRKVEIKKGVFMVNGVPVKFTGMLPPRGILALRPRPDRRVLEDRHQPHEGRQHQRHSHQPLQPRGTVHGTVRRGRLLRPGRNTVLLGRQRDQQCLPHVGLHFSAPRKRSIATRTAPASWPGVAATKAATASTTRPSSTT